MSKVALFFEKMYKVLKNKAQGCSTPLTLQKTKRENTHILQYLVIKLHSHIDIGQSWLHFPHEFHDL